MQTEEDERDVEDEREETWVKSLEVTVTGHIKA